MKTYAFEVDIEQERVDDGVPSFLPRLVAMPGDRPLRKHRPQSATTVIGATQWTEEGLTRLGVYGTRPRS
jgi:hypothetical protein